MEFAREPAGPSAAPELVGRSDAAMRRWILVDAAVLDERSLGLVNASIPLSNALSGSPLAVYGSRAPQWAMLPLNDEGALEIATRILSIDPRAPATSVVWSSAPAASLQALFVYLAQATIDGDLPVHCRFADTRVLPSLLQQLTPSQAARVATDVRGWTWIDHLGNRAAWEPPPGAAAGAADVAADDASHLQLSTSQLTAMLAASEPDTLFDLLLDNTPELVPAENRGRFRDRLSRILASADTRAVETPNDRLQFVILGLGFGDAFHGAPELQATWQAMARGQTTLVAAMQAWDDALWEGLEDRRRQHR